jgi:rhamnosyl/mannosyltransferase
MKIIQTNKAYYPKVGGIETTVKTISEGLVEQFKESVFVLTCHSKRNFKKQYRNLNGVQVTYLPTFGFVSSLPMSPGFFYEISKLSGDILHIHEPFPLADLSLHLIPRIKKNFSKIVVSWHGDIVRQKWTLKFYGKFIFKFLEKVDRILISNPNIIKSSDFLPYFREKCDVIPIGIDLEWCNSVIYSGNMSKKNISKDGETIILFVGRLVYYKGIEFLIEAMKFVSNAKLLIVGSGPLERKLKAQIKNLELNCKIQLVPEVNENILHEYFKACDIFVLPSVEKSETYGIVQIEAMACGKPVICTDISTGTTFINQNNITGLVVPPRNPEKLAEAINKLSNDNELRSNLGVNGKKRALEEFTSSKMVRRVYEIYQEMLLKK